MALCLLKYYNCGDTATPLLTLYFSSTKTLNCDYKTQLAANSCLTGWTALAETPIPPVTVVDSHYILLDVWRFRDLHFIHNNLCLATPI
jgi:hypothetical protein